MASSSSSPSVNEDSTVQVSQHNLDGILHDLDYEDKNVIYRHVTEALAAYPELHPKAETNLLKLAGAVNGRDFVNIYLPSSYPKDPPDVWLVCQYGSAINPDLTNVAPNGLVAIPYMSNWDEDKSTLVSLISHLQVEFTRKPPTFVIDVGIPLSREQMGLVKIVLDFRLMHLYYGIQDLTSEKTSAFFKEVTSRYPKGLEDLADHIMTSKGGVKNYINTVAEILGLPPKTRFTVDVANHRFLP